VSFSNISNVLYNRLRYPIKQNVSIDMWKNLLVRPAIKIVGLDLAPFSEMVVNTVVEVKKTLTTAASYFLVRMIKPDL